MGAAAVVRGRPNKEAPPPRRRHVSASHLASSERRGLAGLYWEGRREEVRKHERRLYGPFPVAPRSPVWRF